MIKDQINNLIDVFEDRFNSIIDIIALIGATFMILFSVILFFMLMLDSNSMPNIFEVIIPPGAIGFFAILMLFALRITRHLTRVDK